MEEEQGADDDDEEDRDQEMEEENGTETTSEINAISEKSINDECFVKPCSSKATSVIRLASQKLPKSTASENMIRAAIKAPYNRQVKKLIVKLKKPFVPVIEEEANLHPPETVTKSIGETIKQEQVIELPSNQNANNSFIDLNQSQNENGMLLECSEDVPFSPLRQSYTPIPINQQNIDNIEMDDVSIVSNDAETIGEHEMHIIKVKSLNDHTPSATSNDKVQSKKQKTSNHNERSDKVAKSDAKTSSTNDIDVVILTVTTTDSENGLYSLHISQYELTILVVLNEFFVFLLKQMRILMPKMK